MEKIKKAFFESPYLSRKHSTYFPVYEQILEKYIGRKNLTIVEIGVQNGGSLFMWRKLLGDDARIIGIDINPNISFFSSFGFEIYIGSQSDPNFWKNTLPKLGEVDIVIDDGGHQIDQQIISFAHTLGVVKDGGCIIIEDTHTSYMREYSGPSPISFINYCKNLIDGINYRSSELDKEKTSEKVVYSLQFFESIVVAHINRKLSAIKAEQVLNHGEKFPGATYGHQESFVAPVQLISRLFKY